MKALVVILLAGCGLDMSTAQPWIPVGGEQRAAPGPSFAAGNTLRVVTYNVEYGPDPEGAAQALLDSPALSSAGVVLLQEIESYPAEGSSRAARFAEALGFGYVYVPARDVADGGTHGLAIASAYPISDVEKMDLPEASNKTQHRIAIRATLDLAGHAVQVIDVHLDTKLDAAQRIAQLSPVIVGAPDQILVAGDFNTSWVEWVGGSVPVLSSAGASDQAPIIESYMRAQGFDAPTADSGPTEHMYGLEQRLDAIYTRGETATFGGVEHVGPSDHWPMWIDLDLQ